MAHPNLQRRSSLAEGRTTRPADVEYVPLFAIGYTCRTVTASRARPPWTPLPRRSEGDHRVNNTKRESDIDRVRASARGWPLADIRSYPAR